MMIMLLPLTMMDFFFCLRRSLQRKTTAVLKTKHIACSSKPFLIFPVDKMIFVIRRIKMMLI